ncbi:MAG: hypothetical protein IVW57_10570 [Ktedonobacterales bacterium]|nr:hypothetical protein [Ktedonobacterales bacterium]
MTGPSLPILGSVELSAQRLLQRARNLVRAGQALDVLHILLAALPDDLARPPTPVTAALLARIQEPELLRKLLNVELRISVMPTTAAGPLSEALVRCAGRWRQVANERGIGVSDAVLLWAIIDDTNAASQTLDEVGVARTALLSALEALFHHTQPELAPETGKLGARVPPASLPPEKVAAYHKAAEMTLVLHPSGRARVREMHAVLMSNVLDVLGTCAPTELVLVVGRNGTPLDVVPRVLAERLASSEAFAEERARLGRYHSVHLLDIQSVCQLARRDNEPDPQDVLEMAMLQSIEEQAILVVDRMEDLKDEQAAERTIEQSLIAQLTERGEALVVGLYELPERGEESVEDALDLRNLRLVDAREYSARETKVLLTEHYVPEWETRGYRFEPEAFDTVIALEPGAWIDLRRKHLPYLAVDLGTATMSMLRDGRALVEQAARMAQEALEALRQEWATTDERTRDRFTEALEDAQRDIEWLLAHPEPPREQGIYLVKRAHITTQLICPNASEFHYPGHAPKERQRTRAADLPADE